MSSCEIRMKAPKPLHIRLREFSEAMRESKAVKLNSRKAGVEETMRDEDQTQGSDLWKCQIYCSHDSSISSPYASDLLPALKGEGSPFLGGSSVWRYIFLHSPPGRASGPLPLSHRDSRLWGF